MRQVISDKRFHIVLFTLIAVLAVAAIYYRNQVGKDAYQEAFLARISSFDQELALQKKPENVKPDSLKVPILVYHSVRAHTANQTALQKYYDVAPEEFTRQMQYLRDHGYVVISLDYLVSALEQRILLPPKSVVITLDDGWRNQYAYAFPILREFGYTATFFIFTNAIDHDNFLTWDQVRVMNNAGMSIGSHTKSHPYIPNVTDPAVLKDEIFASKRIIEEELGQKIYTFAYPYGHATPAATALIQEAGYKTARGTLFGVYHTADDLYDLKSVEVSDNFSDFVSNLNE